MSKVDDRWQSDVVHHQRRSNAAHADAPEFFIENVVVPDVDAFRDATVDFRVAEAQDADLRGFRPKLVGNSACLVPFGRERHHFLVEEPSQLITPFLVFFGQVWVRQSRPIEIE